MSKKKTLTLWTYINFKPHDLLILDKHSPRGVRVDDRFFSSKKKALAFFGCYDNEVYRVKITIEDTTND